MQYTSLPTSQLAAWANMNSIELYGVKIEPHITDEDGKDKGGGLIATSARGEGEQLLLVPSDMVVSKQQVTACARTDTRLSELLEALHDTALGEVGRSNPLMKIMLPAT
jgi:hypothetical protein